MRVGLAILKGLIQSLGDVLGMAVYGITSALIIIGTFEILVYIHDTSDSDGLIICLFDWGITATGLYWAVKLPLTYYRENIQSKKKGPEKSADFTIEDGAGDPD